MKNQSWSTACVRCFKIVLGKWWRDFQPVVELTAKKLRGKMTGIWIVTGF